MTAVVEANRYQMIVGDIKTIVIVTDSAAATGHTVDTGMDSAGGDFKTILGTTLQNTTGTNVSSCTWSNTTGIITLPTISTGVHKLTVWGVC